jgi:chromosomal replication initiation ATPase DnaA
MIDKLEQARRVIAESARAAGLPAAALISGSRAAPVRRARLQAVMRMRSMGMSWRLIGWALGGRDRTTISKCAAKSTR